MAVETILARAALLLSIDIRLFWCVALLYGIASVLFIAGTVTGRTRLGVLGRKLLYAGVAVHVALIALRTYEGGRAPFQTLYESLSWFACTAVVSYLYISRKWKGVYLPGFFVALISAAACLFALLTRTPAVDPLSPALQSYWYECHVILAFTSYAVIVVSCAIEATCLMARARLKTAETALGIAREDLEGFHESATRLVLFGFPFLTFTLFSGAAWANEAWGRYWGWDPKETWALITWTVFAMYLHCRVIPRFKELPASVLNILGFICMIMTFLGVNWLSRLFGVPGLHLYAM